MSPEPSKDAALAPEVDVTLEQEITAYLANGGLFNPELAIHDRVRDLLIRCRAALAVRVSPPPQMWQPIETAPKDGSKLLLFQVKFGPIIGRWLFDSAATPCWWVTNGGWRAEPTHWMPLPVAPETPEP